MNLKEVIARKFDVNDESYKIKDTILYALGTGFGAQPLDPDHLRFTYEKDLQAVPTMANVLGHPGFWSKDPLYDIAWAKLLHAEHRLILHKQLPPEGHIHAVHDIMGVRDVGDKGAWMHQRKTVKDGDTGEDIASVITTLLLRGDGGCGDYGDVPEELEKLPETEPDTVVEVEATEFAPLIYRLSGDYNPIHIDPEIAKSVGFARPINHGLGTMGLACYALLKTFCDFDPTKLKAMAVRFSKPVMPGTTIKFEFWSGDKSKIRFRGRVGDAVVLDRCTAEIG